MSASREEERIKILIALGHQPGVSAWFSLWLQARIGKPSAEVWGGGRGQKTKTRIGGHCHP